MAERELSPHHDADEHQLLAALGRRDPLALAEAISRSLPGAWAQVRQRATGAAEPLLVALYTELWREPPSPGASLAGWLDERISAQDRALGAPSPEAAAPAGDGTADADVPPGLAARLVAAVLAGRTAGPPAAAAGQRARSRADDPYAALREMPPAPPSAARIDPDDPFADLREDTADAGGGERGSSRRTWVRVALALLAVVAVIAALAALGLTAAG